MENNNKTKNQDISWQKIVMKYAKPDAGKSILQITNSLLPYIFMWFLMYKSLSYPFWITLLLAVVASGFLIRLFIIFHDCGHGSFFRSREASTITGILTGILSFTPYRSWHSQHAIHHATSGNLDKRGVGDVLTYTVDEYLNSTGWNKFTYKVFRNPFFLFTLGPVVMVISNRFTRKGMNKKEKNNIYLTNISIVLVASIISLFIGLKAYLLIQLPVIYFAHLFGLWLFYIQHQFDDVQWERGEVWDYKTAALTGCSFLKLPRLLQWFTGNIGYHHVHHLSSRIPNYNLEACHNENEMFRNIKPIRLSSTFRALWLSLWDEKQQKLISFRELRKILEMKALAVSRQAS